jgi:hypothetical protein
VLPSARRFTDLGVKPRQPLTSLKEIEEMPRDVAVDASAADAAPPGPIDDVTRVDG